MTNILRGTLTNPLGKDVPDVMYIEHDGFEIHDPTVSECGRFEVDPSYYGLTPEQVATMVRHNGAKPL